jgi:hypothetical protein
MADMSKLKRRGSLGVPPPAEEASPNLQAPETAPAPAPAASLAVSPVPRPAFSSIQAGQRTLARDGRSARRTGRTLQFATRVSPEFDQRLRDIAERDRLLLVEVLERALDAYEAARGIDR